jgi:hypothetical protein
MLEWCFETRIGRVCVVVSLAAVIAAALSPQARRQLGRW